MLSSATAVIRGYVYVKFKAFLGDEISKDKPITMLVMTNLLF